MFRGRVKHVHFIGVGGIGMSGLAEILRTLEFEVSGSDLKEGENTLLMRHELLVPIVVEQVTPVVDAGRYAPKRIVGQPVEISLEALTERGRFGISLGLERVGDAATLAGDLLLDLGHLGAQRLDRRVVRQQGRRHGAGQRRVGDRPARGTALYRRIAPRAAAAATRPGLTRKSRSASPQGLAAVARVALPLPGSPPAPPPPPKTDLGAADC